MEIVKKPYSSPTLISMPISTSTLSGGFVDDDTEAGYAS